jgi:hypothetical protein
MKKVSLCAIIGAAGLLSATAAYAFDATSISQGVNYNAQTQIGVNNIQGAVQGVVQSHIDSVNDLGHLRVFQDSSAEGGNAGFAFIARGGKGDAATAVKIEGGAFQIGSIVNSGNGGNGGKGGSGKIDIKQIAKIDDPKIDIDADGGRAHAGFLSRAIGGDAEVSKTAQLNVAANGALAFGGNGGDGGAGGAGGNIEQNTIKSNNWTINNTTTSVANLATKGGVAGSSVLKDNLILGSFDSLKNSDHNGVGTVELDRNFVLIP